MAFRDAHALRLDPLDLKLGLEMEWNRPDEVARMEGIPVSVGPGEGCGIRLPTKGTSDLK
jgi:hypothetical protein